MADEDEGFQLPDKMTIRGFAINTSGPGNGLWFNHDQMAEVVGQEAHFVADHDTGIGAIAGTVKFSAADRKRIYVDRVGKKARKTEFATRLAFEAELNSKFNGFERVARNVIALRDADRVPNVSVFVSGSAITYDEDTDRFFLEGPYSMRHLGQVDVGAFSDDVGVGVYDVAFSANGNFSMADLSQVSDVPMSVSVCFENQGDLIAKFADEHGLDSPLFEELGKRLGLDESDLDTSDEEGEEEEVIHEGPGPAAAATTMSIEQPIFGAAAPTQSISLDNGTSSNASFDLSGTGWVPNHILVGDYPPTGTGTGLDSWRDHTFVGGPEKSPEGPYKSADSSEHEGSSESEYEDEHMSDETTTLNDTPDTQAAAGGAPAQEAPKTVGLSEEQVRELLDKELSVRDERIATLEQERDEARERVLTEARKRITDKFDLDEDEQAALAEMPMNALGVFESRLEAASKKGNALPIGLFTRTGEEEPTKEAALLEKQKAAKEWHASRYLSKEAL